MGILKKQQWLQSAIQGAFTPCEDIVLQELFSHRAIIILDPPFSLLCPKRKHLFENDKDETSCVLSQRKRNVYQKKDTSGEISFPLRYDSVVLHRQCRNNNWNFCFHWGIKSFQSLYSLCKNQCWKQRKVVFLQEFELQPPTLQPTNTWLFFFLLRHRCLQSVSKWSAMIRAFKVLPRWEMAFCYFSRLGVTVCLSSAAFLHGVCSRAVGKVAPHHSACVRRWMEPR